MSINGFKAVQFSKCNYEQFNEHRQEEQKGKKKGTIQVVWACQVRI